MTFKYEPKTFYGYNYVPGWVENADGSLENNTQYVTLGIAMLTRKELEVSTLPDDIKKKAIAWHLNSYFIRPKWKLSDSLILTNTSITIDKKTQDIVQYVLKLIQPYIREKFRNQNLVMNDDIVRNIFKKGETVTQPSSSFFSKYGMFIIIFIIGIILVGVYVYKPPV